MCFVSCVKCKALTVYIVYEFFVLYLYCVCVCVCVCVYSVLSMEYQTVLRRIAPVVKQHLDSLVPAAPQLNMCDLAAMVTASSTPHVHSLTCHPPRCIIHARLFSLHIWQSDKLRLWKNQTTKGRIVALLLFSLQNELLLYTLIRWVLHAALNYCLSFSIIPISFLNVSPRDSIPILKCSY